MYTHQSTQAIDFSFHPFLDADLKGTTLLLVKPKVTLSAFMLAVCGVSEPRKSGTRGSGASWPIKEGFIEEVTLALGMEGETDLWGKEA